MYAIDRVRSVVRAWLKHLAKFIDHISRGRITPNQVTITSTLGHGLIAWAIISGRLVLAAAGLILFGLMDAFDGELARLQNRQSHLGIVLDALADRLKETLIYAGIGVYLAGVYSPAVTFWVVAALGVSISLSYVKAKGEAVLASQTDIKLDPQALNRFTGGGVLMQFDVRMAVIVAALLLDKLLVAAVIITLASLAAVISRYGELRHLLEK